ncbi:MAG: redoxin domain-containing protein [Caldilinea sp.]|nr:redoxin domain-containing protein [Caldilinea sp.]MDW8439048.1 redoxin domain-containing protein [Caldilineaceae bacterium]
MGSRVESPSDFLWTKKRVGSISAALFGAIALIAALFWGIRGAAPIFEKSDVPTRRTEAPAPAVSQIAAPAQPISTQESDAADVAAPARPTEAARRGAADEGPPELEIVAFVSGEAITQRDFREARAVDAVMAALAGVQPAPAETIVEQLVNMALVLQWGQVTVDSTQANAALAQFLQTHHKSRADLEAALLAQDVTWDRFERYFARLIAADRYLRSQQAATGASSAELLQSWRQQTPISFGPAAGAVFAAATPATQTAAEALAAPLAESPIEDEPADEKIAPSVSEARGVEIGQLAPEFLLPTLNDSSPKTLQDFSGRPTVLSFWTTWCPYCLRQTPVMVEANRRWDEQGVQFVGVNVREDAGVVAPYVQQHGIEYPVLLDADGVVASSYAVQGYPTTYFLDGNNRIVARHVGALTEEELNNYLQTLRPAE